MEIGELLKEYRLSLGITQKQMAENIVSTSFYSRVEQGISRINAIDLLKILKLHSINKTDFFNQISVDVSDHSNNNAQLINMLFVAFFDNDLSQITTIKSKIEQDSSNSQNVKLYASLIEALLRHDPSLIDDELRFFIKKNLFNGLNWTISNLKLFVNSMFIYEIDELAFFVHSILKKYRATDNEELQKITASICINFLDLSYRNADSTFWNEILSFIKDLPNTPDLLMYKLLAKYYQALLAKDPTTLKQIRDILLLGGYHKYLDLLPKY